MSAHGSSSSLLERARRRDAAALAELIDRHLPALHRWTHGRLPRWARAVTETSDLIHEAVLRVVCRLDALDIRSERALGAYLRATVQNRIHDERRKTIRRGPHTDALDGLTQGGPTPFDTAAREETRRRYRAALARLREGDRELVVAHFELGYTHDQIGCMTGRSANAARVALQRAVQRLADAMRDG